MPIRDRATRTLRLLSVLVASCAAVITAQAGGNAIIALTSDYDFRGETQTAKDPAAQVTVEWLGSAGWKAGVFASNVSFKDSAQFGDPRLELAPYVDFRSTLSPTLRAATGLAYYSYHIHGGSDYDFAEGYAALEYRALRGALYYAPDYDGQFTPGHTAGWYAALDGTTALSARWLLLEHTGYSWGQYWQSYGGGCRSDYSLGIVRHFGRTDLSVSYIYTRRTPASATDPGSSGRALVALTRTVPW